MASHHPGAAMAPDPHLVPPILATWLSVFRPCFTAPVWNRILVLVAGAVLAPGKRTVTQVLRVMGLADEPSFRRYHEVLNLGAAGDPANQTLAAKRHLVFVADSGFAALELLAAVRSHVCMITRLRLDANLFRPAPKRRPGQRGRTPLKGRAFPKLSAVLKNKKTVWTSVVVSQWYNAQQRRLLVATGTALWYHTGIAPVPIRWVLVRDPSGEHEPAAFLSTDLDAQPAAILGWFVSRWRLETTFQGVRAHLGVETQRQWSDLAILRTTPALLGLFSLICRCNQKPRERETTMSDTTKKIAELNDLCRKAMGVAGKLFQTEGISALPLADQSAVREKVETFNTFTEDNDPHGERDFGAFEHNGERIFWKIDYYARDMQHGSEDPSGAVRERGPSFPSPPEGQDGPYIRSARPPRVPN